MLTKLHEDTFVQGDKILRKVGVSLIFLMLEYYKR